MTPQELHIDIATRWFKAFNDHNIEDLLSLYHDNAQHYSPKLKALRPETFGIVQGKAAMRDWWADAFRRLPSLSYSSTTVTADQNRVFLEYIRRVDTEPEMMVAEVLQIKNGLIIVSRVYHG
jgi:ketosteroid isomerase-like protein